MILGRNLRIFFLIDLKPGNILVCEAGPDSPQVKVLDFGLADLLAGPNETGSV